MESGPDSTIICTHKTRRRRKRRFFSTLCLLALLMLGSSALRAQQDQDYAVHANIIYHFTKYINWPDEKKSGDFVIAVIGDSPLYEKLKTLIGVNKSVNGQRIVVRKYATSTQSFNCHILF